MQMKKFLITGLLFISAMASAQTEGMLSVSVTTKSTGISGRTYAPRNCLAIWIQDEKGNFVKTLYVNAMARRTHLNAWEAATGKAGSAFNTVDAVTGATAVNHGQRTCSWDGSNYKNQKVPDGKYFIFMELTDLDASGRVASFPFTKGPVKNSASAPDQQSFTAISVSWIPA
jgi:hypothetical protein